MIEIINAYRRGNEWCTCCNSDHDTKRIQLSQDGRSGLSFVLCPRCRKELIDTIVMADKKY